MKKYLGNGFVALGLAFLFVGFLFTNDVNFPLRAGQATTTYSTTYADGQCDTLEFAREAGLSGASFAVYVADSADWGVIRVQHIINGVAIPAVSADTLSSADSVTAAGARAYTITLTPLAESYKVIVNFAANDGGVVSGQTNNVRYSINRQYSN